MSRYQIKLWGGPADGHAVQVAELRDTYLMPCPLETVVSTPNVDVMRMPVAVYEPIRDPATGYPPQGDHGCYRYQYTGMH